MRLATDDGRIGAVVLTAEAADRYVADHARLLGLLEEPFIIALANVLVHREVVRLRDRLAEDYRHLQQELLRLTGDQTVGADFGLREVMHSAGELLGVNPNTLRHRMRKLGIPVRKDLRAETR